MSPCARNAVIGIQFRGARRICYLHRPFATLFFRPIILAQLLMKLLRDRTITECFTIVSMDLDQFKLDRINKD